MSTWYKNILEKRKTYNEKKKIDKTHVTAYSVIKNLKIRDKAKEDMRQLNKDYYDMITPYEKVTYQNLFKSIDVDGGGDLSFQEISTFIRKKVKNITEKAILDVLNTMDENGDQTIDEKEFCVFMKRMEYPMDITAIKRYFQLIDFNNNGSITREELFRFYHNLGFSHLTFSDINKLFMKKNLSKHGMDIKSFSESFEFKDYMKMDLDV